MIYKEGTITKIIEELHKVPNIRHVCSKIGIDHSTFYRWMTKYLEFHQAVEGALLLGRKNINDAAESVIINGIQKGEFNSAKYWLSHNEERYIESKEVKYFQYLERHQLAFLKRKEDGDPFLEATFEHFAFLEKTLDSATARQEILYFINGLYNGDRDQIRIFRERYLTWKEKKRQPTGEDPDILDSLDQSVIH